MPPEDGNQRKSKLLVPRDHPALPGHFPGNPVVPGVLILHEVIVAISEWLGHEVEVRCVPQAKFLAALRPGEEAVMELSHHGGTVSFNVLRGQTIIAKGTLGLEPRWSS
jgi:3-hydroxymyristoyl/3-hydroxydecanoyl-(acyl carrier protein) dehydratase